MIFKSLQKLITWIEKENYKGYDPYDYLSSPIFRNLKSKKIKFYIQQIGKFDFINLRKALGIRKAYNPKGLALISLAYIKLYETTGEIEYVKKTEKLINILKNLKFSGFKEFSWGYNFPWVNKNFYLPAYHPSAVVTSTVGNLFFEYYKMVQRDDIFNILVSIKDFILNRLNRFENDKHLCFSYTPYDNTKIFNASLMATEFLARLYSLTYEKKLISIIEKSVKYVIDNQNNNGSWIYGFNANNEKIILYDFHQGFVLRSLKNISQYTHIEISKSIEKGLKFYKNKLFKDNGMSLYRYPKKWPVDIHNQAEGILTFSLFGDVEFAERIAVWSINNMQDPKGFFYYQVWPFLVNKIPYIRWNNAWMMLALSNLLKIRGKLE